MKTFNSVIHVNSESNSETFIRKQLRIEAIDYLVSRQQSCIYGDINIVCIGVIYMPINIYILFMLSCKLSYSGPGYRIATDRGLLEYEIVARILSYYYDE